MNWLRQHYALLRLPSVQLAGVISALAFVVTTNQWLAFSFFTTMPEGWLRWLYGALVAFLVFIFPAYARYREQHPASLKLTAEPPKPQSTWGWLVAAAVALAAPVTAEMEGYVSKPTPDPIGISSICYGERIDQTAIEVGKIYSKAECLDRLRARLTQEYAPVIAKCVPGLADPRRRGPFAASIDLAWNIGPQAFCGSAIAKHFNAGLWTQGCSHFPDWNKARGQVLPGLVRRRQIERNLCLGVTK